MQLEYLVDIACDLLLVRLAMQHRHLTAVDLARDLLEPAGDEGEQVGRDQVRAPEANDPAHPAVDRRLYGRVGHRDPAVGQNKRQLERRLEIGLVK